MSEPGGHKGEREGLSPRCPGLTVRSFRHLHRGSDWKIMHLNHAYRADLTLRPSNQGALASLSLRTVDRAGGLVLAPLLLLGIGRGEDATREKRTRI